MYIKIGQSIDMISLKETYMKQCDKVLKYKEKDLKIQTKYKEELRN